MLRVVVCLLLFSTVASGQGPAAYAPLDTQYFAGRPAEALAGYEALLVQDSANVEVLWRAARAAMALGVLAERQDPDSPMYLRAEALARTIVRVSPERVEGHYWLAAAMGRRALHADMRTTVSLAKATAAEANRALAIDSLHAGTHDVLGKLNSEVSKLPAFVRFVAGNILGVSVARATSWEQAEYHLRRAVELEPTMILYRLDLAEMYTRMGRRTDAIRVLKEVVAMPRVQPVDEKLQREAEGMLGGIDRQR